MRTGPQVPQTSCTLEIEIRLSCSAIPPLIFRCGFGRTCFFTIITCSTRTLASLGNTRRTRPSLPLSRPVITFTVSFRRMSTRLCAVNTVAMFKSRSSNSVTRNFVILEKRAPVTKPDDPITKSLDNLWRQGNDLQKPLLAQFPGDRTENARPHRLACFVDQDRGILVEADIGSIPTPMFFPGAYDDRLHHFALLHLALGSRLFHGCSDHVAQTGIQSGRTAQRQNHLQLARAGIVGDLQHCSHHHSHGQSPSRNLFGPARLRWSLLLSSPGPVPPCG